MLAPSAANYPGPCRTDRCVQWQQNWTVKYAFFPKRIDVDGRPKFVWLAFYYENFGCEIFVNTQCQNIVKYSIRRSDHPLSLSE